MSSKSAFAYVLIVVLVQVASLATGFTFKPPKYEASHSSQLNSGILKLIVKTYLDDLLSESSIEDEKLKRKLFELGNHITTHPALKQKNLYVGDKPPNYDPDYTMGGSLRSLSSINKRQNRISPPMATKNPLFSITATGAIEKSTPSKLPSEEICSTDRQWEQINETNDFHDNKVQVVQDADMQQFVFTYRCANVKGPCTGIQPFYHSECTERFGWVFLYHKKDNEKPKWGYVAAPHHCACKIQPNATPSSSKKH